MDGSYCKTDFVLGDNMRIIFPLGSYLVQRNAVLILTALLKYIDGDENALDSYEKQLFSTHVFSSKEEVIKDESFIPTISQIETWVQQEVVV